MTSPLQTTLLADGPAEAGRLDLFGRFVGSWDIDVTFTDPDGTVRRFAGAWHFGWVLGGRAVQDVLVLPGQTGDPAGGSTLRVPSRTDDTWRVCWAAPESGNFCTMVARADGAGIRLDGRNHAPDELLCWRFTEITDDSFRWTGAVSLDDGRTWREEEVMLATRRQSSF